jgi:hypothetical protein
LQDCTDEQLLATVRGRRREPIASNPIATFAWCHERNDSLKYHAAATLIAQA